MVIFYSWRKSSSMKKACFYQIGELQSFVDALNALTVHLNDKCMMWPTSDSFIFKLQGSKYMYFRTDIFSCAILM